MKKQVKAVLVPQNKEGYSEGDIVKHDGSGFTQVFICDRDIDPHVDGWQAQQLLILDEQAEPKDSDTVLIGDSVGLYGTRSTDEKAVKIIASHPQIPGTLPISPDFLTEFVKRPDAKVYVEMWTDGEAVPDYDNGGTITPYTLTRKMERNELFKKRTRDIVFTEKKR